MDKKYKSLVLFDVVGSLFFSCTNLTVCMDDYDISKNIDVKYLQQLVVVLRRLNNIYHSKLKKIKIANIRHEMQRDEVNQQCFKFYHVNWKLDIQQIPNDAQCNLVLTRRKSVKLSMRISRSLN